MRLELGCEYPPADEQRHIESLIRQLGGKMESDYGGKRMLRDAHPKMHGCLRGEFTVLPDLPESLRVGLFRESRTYPLWLRFSNANNAVREDTKGDIRGLGLKLVGVPGEKLLPDSPTHDFVLITADRFVARDAAEFDGLVRALLGGKGAVLAFLVLHPRSLMSLASANRTFSNLLQVRFFSVAPYLFGERAVKYCLTPRLPDNSRAPHGAGPDYLRDAMTAWLASREAVFDFGIQFQTDPYSMPIEDALTRWDERESPFHTAATVRIPPQVFDTAERREFGDNLSFNPWRCLPEHRPLGGISRARREVYGALSDLRHRTNGAVQAEPVE